MTRARAEPFSNRMDTVSPSASCSASRTGRPRLSVVREKPRANVLVISMADRDAESRSSSARLASTRRDTACRRLFRDAPFRLALCQRPGEHARDSFAQAPSWMQQPADTHAVRSQASSRFDQVARSARQDTVRRSVAIPAEQAPWPSASAQRFAWPTANERLESTAIDSGAGSPASLSPDAFRVSKATEAPSTSAATQENRRRSASALSRRQPYRQS